MQPEYCTDPDVERAMRDARRIRELQGALFAVIAVVAVETIALFVTAGVRAAAVLPLAGLVMAFVGKLKR